MSKRLEEHLYLKNKGWRHNQKFGETMDEWVDYWTHPRTRAKQFTPSEALNVQMRIDVGLDRKVEK